MLDDTWLGPPKSKHHLRYPLHSEQMFYTLPHPRSVVRPVNPYMAYPRPVDPLYQDPNRIRRVYSFNQFNSQFMFQNGSLRDLRYGQHGSLQRQSR